ncbi:MAG TPA: hypothetical protein PLP17_02100 [Oligoflexia bacterium]|nr:hypothetical protein [Oligoflexia bacterium]
MNSLDFLVIFVLGTLGVVFLVYLSALILLPLAEFFRILRSSSHVRSIAGRLKHVDKLIAERKYLDALKALRKSVMAELIIAPAVVESLREHHQNVLSRCLVIAEELNSHPANIAEVERLLTERVELHVLLIRASESYQGLKNRRERSGKSFPLWSKTEFEKRSSQIRSEIKRNSTALEAALDHLFSSVASGAKDSITYH